jgi:hypothetical protein
MDINQSSKDLYLRVRSTKTCDHREATQKELLYFLHLHSNGFIRHGSVCIIFMHDLIVFIERTDLILSGL